MQGIGFSVQVQSPASKVHSRTSRGQDPGFSVQDPTGVQGPGPEFHTEPARNQISGTPAANLNNGSDSRCSSCHFEQRVQNLVAPTAILIQGFRFWLLRLPFSAKGSNPGRSNSHFQQTVRILVAPAVILSQGFAFRLLQLLI